MEPSGELVNYTAQWEGTFDRGGYTYTLSSSLVRHGKDILTQALSTMVLVPGSGEQTVDLSNDTSPPAEPTGSTGPTVPENATDTPESTASSPYGLHPEGEDQVREAVEQYYYAVDYEEWAATYYNLDSESKALFTQEEWIAKNQWYADHEDLKLDSMSIDVTMESEEEARVTVDRTFTDGTSITRETYFVWDNGWWKHHLTEEEKEIFMPGVPYEEFVAAQE